MWLSKASKYQCMKFCPKKNIISANFWVFIYCHLGIYWELKDTETQLGDGIGSAGVTVGLSDLRGLL